MTTERPIWYWIRVICSTDTMPENLASAAGLISMWWGVIRHIIYYWPVVVAFLFFLNNIVGYYNTTLIIMFVMAGLPHWCYMSETAEHHVRKKAEKIVGGSHEKI